ncbi:MAG: hypothetical protein GY820_14290 [Gammaproteobacteria bacterium]|nr:hypothetical protein [Gammaproteobacteria bacterium]
MQRAKCVRSTVSLQVGTFLQQSAASCMTCDWPIKPKLRTNIHSYAGTNFFAVGKSQLEQDNADGVSFQTSVNAPYA